jgi:hypothetical protein
MTGGTPSAGTPTGGSPTGGSPTGGSPTSGSPTGEAPPDGRTGQLRWFATFWVLAAVFDYTDSVPWEALPTLLVGIPVLVRPTSAPLLGLFVAVTTGLSLRYLPGVANHQALSLLVGLALGGAALWTLARDGRDGFAARWLDTARGPVALTLLVVYFFTVFHKLNTAFLSPDSCAGHLLRRGFELNGLPPPAVGPGLVQALAVGTIAVETALFVCLAVPRTRRWGLLLGVAFHSLLAPASFWDFSTTVFALYLLFLPPRVFADAAPRTEGLRRWVLLAFGGHLLLSLTAAATGTSGTRFGLQWHTVQVVSWYACVLPVLAVLLRAAFDGSGARGASWPRLLTGPVVLLVVPVLAFGNGATPYLGVKTTANYSMFSNLHVEGDATNHLLPWTTAPRLAPYTRDLVTVLRIDEPDEVSIPVPPWMLESPPHTVPWLELRRVVRLWRAEGGTGRSAVRVDYVRDGVARTVPDAVADPVLGAPMPWWQSTLLTFRALHSGDGPDVCRW